MKNGPYGILSGHQGVEDNDEHKALNNERTKRLKQRVRDLGHGFVNVSGAWKYNDDTMSRYIPEKSLFIPGADQQTLQDLAKEFNQEAYLSGSNGSFGVRNTHTNDPYLEGTIDDYLHVVRPGEEPYATTGIKGKQFTFQPPVDVEQPFAPENYNEYSELLDESRNNRAAGPNTVWKGVYIYRFASRPHPATPHEGLRGLGTYQILPVELLDVFLPVFAPNPPHSRVG
jgi:hypothetical protein